MGSDPDDAVGVFRRRNPSNRTMSLGLTELFREINTRNLPGGQGRPVRKADCLTDICEHIT
jgi:hypothetical protein